MELDYLEFDDPDDPQSNSHPSRKEALSFRLTIAIRALLLLLPGGKRLGSADQDMFERLMRLAYEQGKRVGQEMTHD